MADFIKLCENIIDSNGNPSTEDVLGCGFSMEHFIRISQSNIKPERLVKNARRALLDRGIPCKETEEVEKKKKKNYREQY